TERSLKAHPIFQEPTAAASLDSSVESYYRFRYGTLNRLFDFVLLRIQKTEGWPVVLVAIALSDTLVNIGLKLSASRFAPASLSITNLYRQKVRLYSWTMIARLNLQHCYPQELISSLFRPLKKLMS